MFSKPNAGWSQFNYGGIQANASYIDDLPQEWLIKLLAHYKLVRPCRTFVLGIDEEGSDVIIVWNGSCFMAIRDNQVSLMHGCVEDFALEFCGDLENNIDDWVDFVPGELTKDEFTSRKKSILSKIRKLRKAVKFKNILTERVF